MLLQFLRKRLQKLAFPKGIVFDMENRAFLTPTANEIFKVSINTSGSYYDKKRDNNEINPLSSRVVARSGVEPETSGL